MSVRFIHTADLHLGATFKGLVSSSERIGTSLKEAVPTTFHAIVDLALNEQVDFVIIAGDIFDSPHVSYGLQRDFVHELERLGQADIVAYLCTGNHDPLSSWGVRLATLPANVVMFGASEPQRIEHIRDGETVAALYGQSYLDRVEPRDLAAGMQAQAGDPLSIGVVHADLVKGEPYAPTSISVLKGAGMDYWALGHIHKTQLLSEDPPVVYAGSPQGLNINESSKHGCYLVELEKGAAPHVEFVPMANILWERLTIDCSAFSFPEELEAHLVEYASDMLARSHANICARITLTGRTPLHARLREPELLDDICAEVWGRCETGSSWFWVDKIVDKTRPVLDEEALRESELFIATFLENVETAMGDGDTNSGAAAEACARLVGAAEDELYKLMGKGSGDILKKLKMENSLANAKTLVLDELMGGESS